MNNSRKKTILTFVLVAVIVVIAIILQQNGFIPSKMGSRAGWTENIGNKSWEVNYISLDGKFSKYIKPENNTVIVEVVTKSGELTIELTDKDGNSIFNHKFTESESLEVPVSGRIKIKATADDHSGGFTVK
ncbi:MAG: hypothetical protein K5679_04670 [Lachnospiraceae bacterium]|nr:hypothetical protein [Lachnospiraceae bacterium]